MYIECSIQNEDETRIFVKIEGRITAANAGQFDQSIRHLISNKPDKSLVLDFEKVDYISSAGLRGLMIGHKTASSKGGKFTLINVGEAVNEVLRVTGLDKALNIQ